MKIYLRENNSSELWTEQHGWLSKYSAPQKQFFISYPELEYELEWTRTLMAWRFIELIMTNVMFIPQKEPKTRTNFPTWETQIKTLVEKGDLVRAKKMLVENDINNSVSQSKWRRVLAEPVVTPGSPASGKNIKNDIAWIKTHSDQYKGQWVAIKDGKLLGNNKRRLALQQELKELNELRGALFFKVEE